ncbi:MAG: hypothetical protein R2758_11670 [Bacteroidales bacterium]
MILTRHYAIDIVTQPKAVVSSTLEGTVIMTGWTMETEFCDYDTARQQPGIGLQAQRQAAEGDGDRVWAGEAISIVGDSGEHILRVRIFILNYGLTGSRLIRHSMYSSDRRVTDA